MALVSGRMALSRVIFRSQYYSPVNRYKCKLTNDQPPSASTVGRPSIDSTSGLPKPRQSLSESTFGNLFKLVSPSVNSTNGHPPPPPPSSSGVWWKLLGSAIFSYIGIFALAEYNSWAKDNGIHKALRNGNFKHVDYVLSNIQHEINRPNLLEEIKTAIKGDGSKKFSVILGPTGTGKSILSMRACKEIGEGALYFSLDAVDLFPQLLARAVGMKLQRSIFDLPVLLFGLEDAGSFHKLPVDYVESMEYVIDRVAEVGKKHKEKFGRPPSLIVDGIDLLAKNRPKDFVKLIDLAKGKAEDGTLRLVFVSSEGHIVPLIAETSSKSRSEFFVEVLDIPDDDAESFLVSFKLPRRLAKDFVMYAGSRFVFLLMAVEMYVKYKDTLNEEEILEQTKRFLDAKYVNTAIESVYETGKMARVIIDQLKISHHISLDTLYRDHDVTYVNSMKKAVNALVKANLLRYDRQAFLCWHNKVVREAALTKF